LQSDVAGHDRDRIPARNDFTDKLLTAGWLESDRNLTTHCHFQPLFNWVETHAPSAF
jgi:hypothetical protein